MLAYALAPKANTIKVDCPQQRCIRASSNRFGVSEISKMAVADVTVLKERWMRPAASNLRDLQDRTPSRLLLLRKTTHP